MDIILIAKLTEKMGANFFRFEYKGRYHGQKIEEVLIKALNYDLEENAEYILSFELKEITGLIMHGEAKKIRALDDFDLAN